MLYFGFVMVVIYLGLGITLMFFKVFTYIPKEIKSIFGFFFFVYGAFRLVRTWQQYKEMRET